MKKLLFLAMIVASLFATAGTSNRANPFPECSPCPFVR